MIRKSTNRILNHITIPILLIVLIFIFTIVFVVIPVIEENMMSSKRAMIKELTNITWDLLEDYHKREVNNELSKDEAQDKVIERIRELRYGSKSKGYFWINNMSAKLIMHPYLSHLENQDVSDFTDLNGKHLFTEFVKAVKKDGEGYIDYVWQQIDDSTHIESKLSYVKGFEPWGWVIGTGVYIDDVKQQMFGIKKKFNITFIGIFILFLIVSVYLIIHGRKIEISKKTAQAALSQSENRYHILFNTAADAIFLTKGDNAEIVDVNRISLEMFGCRKEEIIGSTPIDFSPVTQPNGKESKVLGMEKISKALKGESQLFEWQHKKLDGTLFDVEINLHLIELPTGEHIQAIIRDITDRKKAEKAQAALSISENRYHILFNSAADAIFLTKGDSAEIIDVNRKSLEMFGCRKEEIIGHSPIDFSPFTQPNGEESKVSALEKISLALKGQPQLFEWQHKKLDGTLFDVEINLHLIYLPTGEHIQAIIRDITDRKKAEKAQAALFLSENRYHILFNSAADAIFLTKGDSAEIVDVNRKSLEMFGCNKEEIIGFTPIDFSPDTQPNGEESKVLALKKISSALKGEPQLFEWQHKKLDGTLFDVEINLHLIELPTGEHIQAIIRDITDRKKAEKAEVALSQSENRYHILFNTAADAIFLTKGDGAEIVDVNRISLEMFGCRKEEIIGFTPIDFSPDIQPNGEESKVLAMKKISSALKGEPQLFEWQHKKLDGTLFDVEINLHLIELPAGEHIQAIIRNITDRKKSEKALLNEKNRVANIIEGTNAGTWDWNIQTGEVRLNKRWAEITGYIIKEQEPISVQAWIKNIHSDDLPKVNDLLEKNIKGEIDYYDIEYRRQHKNGNWVWVNSRGKVVEWTEDRKPLRMSGTLLDINESKIAEDKLQKSESHYRKIFNNSLIGIYQTTPDGRILAANPALIRMLGYSSLDELLERNLENESENFAIGISRSKFKKQIESEGHIIGIETEWKRKDGTILYVRENANTVVDERGKILFYEGTVDDITYKKKAEIEILAANEELLATSDALKESNHELQIALDEAKRSKELEIANEKLQRNEKILIQAHESINQKKSELEELNFALKKSHDKTTQLNEELSALNEHLFYQKDKLESTIDKLKKTQSQLVQSEKMASVGILTSGIAHEINNPLNFIQGGKLAIENYIEENLIERSDDFKPLLDIIETGINRASDIISSLNRFNRKSDTLNEKCEIHIILDNCLIMLQNKLKHKVKVINHYTNSDFVILGNEGKLHQVFLNILSNAEQSIEKEGIIEITTAIENDKLEIKISDNGYGISEENLTKIIDPFFTTKDPGKGTGLGLSIAYQIIQNHKGNIKINSQLKKGTTVIVTLPIINNET